MIIDWEVARYDWAGMHEARQRETGPQRSIQLGHPDDPSEPKATWAQWWQWWRCCCQLMIGSTGCLDTPMVPREPQACEESNLNQTKLWWGGRWRWWGRWWSPGSPKPEKSVISTKLWWGSSEFRGWGWSARGEWWWWGCVVWGKKRFPYYGQCP